MYRVGICDDAESVCASLEEMVLRFSRDNEVHIETEIWHTGEKLYDHLKDGGEIDILFLDIELYEMSGIEVGGFIRSSLEDRRMQIVYISGKASHALELFQTQPMDFLIKPVTQEQIDRCLRLALKLIVRNNKRFTYRNGKEYFYVSYGEILYFASEGRKVKIITDHGEREFYGKLKEVLKELPEQFLVIHKSFAVNRERVFRYTYESVEFPDGTVLSISKIYRKQVRELLTRKER